MAYPPYYVIEDFSRSQENIPVVPKACASVPPACQSSDGQAAPATPTPPPPPPPPGCPETGVSRSDRNTCDDMARTEAIQCPTPWPNKLIMAPPFYADLGKNARDVFNRGYHFGLLKLDVKTRTNTGVEFSTGGVSSMENGNIFGSLESKYKFKEYGVTFTEKWNTENVLATEIALSDFCEGARLSADTSFSPPTGDKTLRMKAEFKNESCALNVDADFKSGGPIIKGGAVLGYGGWLCGYQTSFDTSKSTLTENKFSMGFCTKDFILNTSIDDGRHFSGSIFHKLSNKLETGIQINWASDNSATEFGIGCKYNLDPDAALRVKINNKALLGLGYSQRLREGVTLSLSTQIDGQAFHEGGHKVGLCLELEA